MLRLVACIPLEQSYAASDLFESSATLVNVPVTTHTPAEVEPQCVSVHSIFGLKQFVHTRNRHQCCLALFLTFRHNSFPPVCGPFLLKDATAATTTARTTITLLKRLRAGCRARETRISTAVVGTRSVCTVATRINRYIQPLDKTAC